MSHPILVIARLTVREAARRRLLWALIGITLLAVAVTTWGFDRVVDLTSSPFTSEAQIRLIVSQLLIVVTFMFSFVLATASVFAGAPAISSEVESGVALAVLARPIRRRDVVIGKWLGLATLIAAYTTAATAIEYTLVGIVTGYSPPHQFGAMGYLVLEGVVLMTFALALSTRLTGMVGGVIALALFGLAWIMGVVAGIGQVLENEALVNAGTLVRLVFPTDGVWRGAVFSLEPTTILLAAAGAPRGMTGNPFFEAAPPPLAYHVWVVAWLALLLGLAIASFERREV